MSENDVQKASTSVRLVRHESRSWESVPGFVAGCFESIRRVLLFRQHKQSCQVLTGWGTVIHRTVYVALTGRLRGISSMLLQTLKGQFSICKAESAGQAVSGLV